jgi:DNA-binding NarL/FixJ family response regulator
MLIHCYAMNDATTTAPITIALVEDEPETHARLLAALHSDASLRVIHATSSAQPMLHWLSSSTLAAGDPNVLLVDLGLPDHSGLEVIRMCKILRPQTEIMVVTMFGDEANMIRAFEAGASGYLLKDGTEDELAQHVQTLHAGGSPMSPIIARQLLLRMGKSAVPAAFAPPLATFQSPPQASVATPPVADKPDRLLTEREETVLQHLARGYTYGELAKQMGVTVNTIQTHIRGLYAKLEVHSKSEAIHEAKQLGILAH